MANLQQAPELSFIGEKNNSQFYMIPQDIATIIFNELGNSSAQLRLMMVLLGTKPGFKISDKWICDKTGLQHPSYINARKALVKRGWLSHDAAKGITVNINAIYCSNTTLPQNEEVIPHYPNNEIEVIPHYYDRGNTTLPITNNRETDNSTTYKGAAPRKLETTPARSEEEFKKQWGWI